LGGSPTTEDQQPEINQQQDWANCLVSNEGAERLLHELANGPLFVILGREGSGFAAQAAAAAV